LDTGVVATQRDGIAMQKSGRFGVVALDEGDSEAEQLPAALRDRLAFHMTLKADIDEEDQIPWLRQDVSRAQALLPQVKVDDAALHALCSAAEALGVDSLRAPLLAVRLARVAAALAGAVHVEDDHIALAARLVLAPRATRLPTSGADQPAPDVVEPKPEADNSEQTPKPDEKSSPCETAPPEESGLEEENKAHTNKQPLAESVLEAARAGIPACLLATLQFERGANHKGMSAGRSGASMVSKTRGRPLGARRGEPRAGARLNVLETLRAAAPWQKLRTPIQPSSTTVNAVARTLRIQVRREDFHITRYKQVSQTTTVFVVDASGSAALHRLAETKGAVELLLADCYVRRDHVAVLAFRGKTAEVLLAPTRSLARAKRSLAGLPGGGGTPLAAGLKAAHLLADQIVRRGETPVLVVLTDGRANIALDGSAGRARASEDAQREARQMKGQRYMSLVLDTAAQPEVLARDLAAAMGATYLPLPYAGARAMSAAVKAAVSGVQR
jgi:magnesium chelatase subunit D